MEDEPSKGAGAGPRQTSRGARYHVELETLPDRRTPFKTRAYQAAIVRNSVESAELVRAHIVTRGKVTAEMLEAFTAPWAWEAIPVEPGVNRRDRIKIDQDSNSSLHCSNEICTRRSLVERGFFR